MKMMKESKLKVFPNMKSRHDILDKENLKYCVAKGAVLYGLLRSGIQHEQHVHLLNDGRRLPHSYGVQVLKGFNMAFEPIIEVGTEYPIKVTKHFDVRVGQQHQTVKILQNSGRKKDVKGNKSIRHIGTVTVESYKGKQAGCEVTFLIDVNRKMDVLVNGKKVDIEPIPFEDEERWIG